MVQLQQPTTPAAACSHLVKTQVGSTLSPLAKNSRPGPGGTSDGRGYSQHPTSDQEPRTSLRIAATLTPARWLLKKDRHLRTPECRLVLVTRASRARPLQGQSGE